MEKPLTQKQWKWLDCYLRVRNAEEAARIAGYAGDRFALSTIGAINLKHPRLRAEIEKVEKEARHQLVATARERQIFWTTIMRGKITEVFDGEVIERIISVPDRLKASELLARACGDFVERAEIVGAIAHTLSVEVKAYSNEEVLRLLDAEETEVLNP